RRDVGEACPEYVPKLCVPEEAGAAMIPRRQRCLECASIHARARVCVRALSLTREAIAAHDDYVGVEEAAVARGRLLVPAVEFAEPVHLPLVAAFDRVALFLALLAGPVAGPDP